MRPRLSRRHAFAAGLGLALGAAGCSRAKPPTWPRRTRHQGIDFVELFPNDADESAPLVVAIHGLGDKPDNWIDSWTPFPARVQIAIPQGHTRHGDGFSWFDFKDGMTDAEFGAELGASEEKLWRGIDELAGKRRVVVTGFSQGGFLCFAMASRHPDRVVKAFPVGASCPGPLLPKNGAKTAPVVAFHGTADQVLAFKWGKAAVDAFKEQGNDAVLREYPGVGHAIPPPMRADLWREIQAALPR
ncbi:MAG: dienelactone hydrolase family protein [Deltaproteobacteria bacterium]|nr:dienelactone hydrolase family protein [Deltaproteobacteria bacterium]